MFSKQAKEELTLQLILMGISLLLTALLYWLILMPQWKRQALILRAVKAMENGSEKARELTGKEVLLVQEFAQKISEWDHAQLAKFRKKKSNAGISESEPAGPETCDNPEESN
jgi:LPS O-antigen subunit length determinant protein (WzzB/FepE family)